MDPILAFNSRIKNLNSRDINVDGKSVVYVMSREQRVNYNFGLLAAIETSKRLKLPLLAFFNLYSKVNVRNGSQFIWMLEGLKEVELKLAELNIPFYILEGTFFDNLKMIERMYSPALIYFDFSPLKSPRKKLDEFVKISEAICYVVDSHNLVPVWIASEKQEIAAQFLRRKIYKVWEDYMSDFNCKESISNFINCYKGDLHRNDFKKFINNYNNEKLNNYEIRVKSGRNAGLKHLTEFIEKSLPNYFEKKNDPNFEATSNLSAYLHFGQISSLEVLLEIKKFYKEIFCLYKLDAGSDKLKLSIASFIEELIIRKELAENYCYYNQNYDNFEGGSDWAKKSLIKHISDAREYIYTLEQFESGKTHDSAWNAAQIQLITTGKMHGYMRMYWAKKILEWSESVESAIKIATYLNDKYELDGYDPNGYAGIMWSICGVHDRPWGERKIFGNVRYMNYAGLKKKFDIEKYEQKYSRDLIK